MVQGARCLALRRDAEFTVDDHIRMTEGVECRKDREVIDETPAAYKPIDAVMAAQPTSLKLRTRSARWFAFKG